MIARQGTKVLEQLSQCLTSDSVNLRRVPRNSDLAVPSEKIWMFSGLERRMPLFWGNSF
jgi:hypothetical protein